MRAAARRAPRVQGYPLRMSVPPIPSLSASQLARLGALGEERTAAVDDVLYRVGDTVYPFIAILEGEVAIVDADGNEIVRHGASSFLGELNLLSGQTVFVTAVVKKPLRYIAVDRDALRALLFDDGPLSDLVLSTFIARREALQRVEGIGLEIVGPRASRGDDADAGLRSREPAPIQLAGRPSRRAERSPHSFGSPAGSSCCTHREASCCARSGSAASSRRARKSTCWSWAPGPPASPLRSTVRPRGSTR